MVEQVGRYKIERELGRGGMGVVYLADDPALGRKVAIKTIHFEITDAAQREYLQTQLVRDARASAGLSHPNVVNVHDIIESGDTTYLVMEYIAGETLSSRLQRTPAPDTAWLLRVLRDTAAALDYTHRKGVVHRDIKPGNIMIDQHSRVRIMDFGLARSTAQRSAVGSGLVAGTIQYMSPEQIRGEALDGRADQFSMAAVAYEILTGKALFEARTPVTMAQKILNESPSPAHTQNPTLPETTSAVLAKALDRLPSGRYPTCTAFVEALIATFDGATVQAMLRPPEEQPTIALTGMVDMGPEVQIGPKPSTAPVQQQPGRWSGYAPLLVAAGLIVGAVAFTAVAVINGRTHGQGPSRPPQPYGPPPMIGRDPTFVPGKTPGFPPRIHKHPPPDVPPNVPMLNADIGHTPPPDLKDNSDEERRKKREARHRELQREFPLIPDFSRDLHAPEPKLLQDGRAQLTARNYGIAIDLFTAAINLAPDDFHAYFYRGAAYLGAGNPKLAQADYDKLVKMRPDDPQGWYQLGIAQENQHHMKEALENYAHAVSLKPDMADAYYASAMIYDQELAPQKALEQLDKAIGANPKYIRGYAARAELKKRLGDPGAKDDAQKAKDLAAERKKATN